MIATKESVTAKLCAFARAYHSSFDRPKIFDDTLAFDLLGREEYERVGALIACDFDEDLARDAVGFAPRAVRGALRELIAPIPLSRAAFAERELARFSYERGGCQYVICGAGMDTFTFRNTDRAIRVFELDHPDTLRYKRARLRDLSWSLPETAALVPVDFLQDDLAAALAAAGFDARAPSFFALLGVSYYLAPPALEMTLRKIGSLSSAGSKLVLDFPDETSPPRARLLREITSRLGEEMLHGYTVREISDILERCGFLVDEHATPAKLQARFFAEGANEMRAFENVHIILAKKGEREAESYGLYI